MIQCAICGKELKPGDLMCQHTELEIARYQREGCACGGDHEAEVSIHADDLSPDCAEGLHRRCEAHGGCDGCACHVTST